MEDIATGTNHNETQREDRKINKKYQQTSNSQICIRLPEGEKRKDGGLKKFF